MVQACSPFFIPIFLSGALTATAASLGYEMRVFPARHVAIQRANTFQDALPLPETSSSKDSLAQIAQISAAQYLNIAFGDADHDGKNEAILLWTDPSLVDHYRILEHQGDNIYTEQYVGPFLVPYAICDLDQDGKCEIIGQRGGQIQVYESLDSTSCPTQLVWSSPNEGNVLAYPAIGDTDRDSRMEIIRSVNSLSGSSSLVIYENTGDNSFAEVYRIVVGSQNDSEKVIADLDGDGLIEVAFCGTYGQLHIFESAADNTWLQTLTTAVGLFNAYGIVGGQDTDGNGEPELFIMGDGYWKGVDYATTVVYEAAGDNQFGTVATLRYPGAGHHNALGNLDGFARYEYLMNEESHLFTHRAVAPGQWTLVGVYQVSDTNHTAIQTFDVNQNGRDEVFWETDANQFFQTLVLEYPEAALTDVVGNRGLRPTLTVSPNPCRVYANLLLSSPDRTPGRLTVFDAAGRLVERRPLIWSRNVQGIWPVQGLSPGVYFLRLEDRSGFPIASARGIVIK